nr:major head protein [Microvirus sp.]
MRKSKHNLSNFELTTASMGKLYPVNLREVLPNDTFIGRTECFARMQPLVRPIMHPIKIIFQHWYCPSRILWEDFEEFYTQGGIEETYPIYPTIKFEEAVKAGSLANRLGVPVGQKNLEVSALPFRMYNLIWNDRYRNQELEEPVSIGYESGIDTTTRTELLSPLWSRDYFTTSMLSTQLGNRVGVPVNNITSTSPSIVTSVCKLENYSFSFSLKSLGKFEQSFRATLASFKIPASFLNSFIFSGDSFQYSFSATTNRVGVPVNNITSTSPSIVTSVCKLENYSFSFSLKSLGKFEQSFRATLASFKIPASFLNSFIFSGDSFQYSFSATTNVIASSVITSISFTDSAGFVATFSTSIPVAYSGNITCSFKASLKVGSYTATPDATVIDSTLLPGTDSTLICKSQGVGSYIDLRDLATASHLQKLKEKAEIYGNRYEERLQREFGLRPRDGRIARPEYLGGSSQVFQTSEVLQTAEAENSGVGNMRGHGVSLSSSNRFRFRFPEHGWFMTLMSIRPISIYTQGIDRQLLRRSPTDHYLPDLANAGGMQEVWQEELYATQDNKGVVFGYQGLYDDYRQARSRVTGDFLTTEQDWHLARLFSAPPVLNKDFVSMAKGDFSRIFNVTDTSYDTLLFMINNHLKAYRPIPKRIKTTHIG